MRTAAVVSLLPLLMGSPCGGGGTPPPRDAEVDDDAGADAGRPPEPPCETDLTFELGDDGHPDPVGTAGPQARAGRLSAEDLPASTTPALAPWAAGDFVLANGRVAMLVEDVGPSDGYDPYGGRPVGFARVEDGRLVDAPDPVEVLVLTGRMTPLSDSVGVIADGTDGGPAIVRAVGRMVAVPFFEELTGGPFPQDYGDIATAIDYVLAPDADHVDVVWEYRSPRNRVTRVPITMHGFLFAPRMPIQYAGRGFTDASTQEPYVGYVGEDTTGIAYVADEPLGRGVAESGYESFFTGPRTIGACGVTRITHARIGIAGPDLDPLLTVVDRMRGEPERERVAGRVLEADGEPAPGVRVHATDADGRYLSRVRTADDGTFELGVPPGSDVRLTAYRRGDEVVGPVRPSGEATELRMAPSGFVEITATDAELGEPLPVRVQLRPADGTRLPSVPGHYGEPGVTSGRLHVEFPVDGVARLRAPVGRWEAIVSRGYEYELHTEVVDVVAGETTTVTASLSRVVDTAGVQCGDFHIHTRGSADDGDGVELKLRSAIADGLEIPVRTEHEGVMSFAADIARLDVGRWAYGMTGIEATSMEVYGHFGVVPITRTDGINGGAPLWQRFPTLEEPDVELETLSPPAFFDAIRARPEGSRVIINHPRGGDNYFDYAGYDPVTGTVEDPDAWDEQFGLVEVFNDSGWLRRRDRDVVDWLSFLSRGRRVFAVGSSDSHGLMGSPVGYPRTCVELGTDDPRDLDDATIADALIAGHSTIVGGVYVDAWVGDAGPGDEAVGLGAEARVRIRVQAASWIDVDAIDVVVDGETVEQIDILPEDADLDRPAIRFDEEVVVEVAETGGYVIVAAYGGDSLDPVHPRRAPFGVTNPIFLSR